jgi:hypothetical protein
MNLLLCGKQAILKGFTHRFVVAQNRTDIKDTTPVPPAGGAPAIPMTEVRGFTARIGKRLMGPMAQGKSVHFFCRLFHV